MNRILRFALPALLALAFVSCDMLDKILGVNVLAGLAAVKIDAEDLQDMAADELLDLASSPSFYDNLDDPATLAALEARLDVLLGTLAVGSAEYQEVAILAAEVQLASTGADVVIDNVVDLVQGLATGTVPVPDPADPNTIVAVVQAIFPATLLDDPVAFAAAIQALVDSAAYYEALGASLTGDPPAYATDDINPGAVAQNALVCALIAGITPPASYTSLGEYLYDILSGVTTEPPTSFTIPDTGSGSPLVAIFAAAGLDITALIGDPNAPPPEGGA